MKKKQQKQAQTSNPKTYYRSPRQRRQNARSEIPSRWITGTPASI